MAKEGSVASREVTLGALVHFLKSVKSDPPPSSRRKAKPASFQLKTQSRQRKVFVSVFIDLYHCLPDHLLQQGRLERILNGISEPGP